MRLLRAVVVIIVVGVIALGLVEVGIHFKTERDANSAASAVAHASSAILFAERDNPKSFADKSKDAYTAAVARAKRDHVTLTAFSISPDNRVQVTIAKEAKSIVINRISQWRSWNEFTRTATATPG
jgi:hypothetical protein